DNKLMMMAIKGTQKTAWVGERTQQAAAMVQRAFEKSRDTFSGSCGFWHGMSLSHGFFWRVLQHVYKYRDSLDFVEGETGSVPFLIGAARDLRVTMVKAYPSLDDDPDFTETYVRLALGNWWEHM